MSPAAALLVELVLGVARAARGRALPAGDAVAEALRPEPGLELVSPSGELHSGVVVVADNTAVVALTARHRPPTRSACRPPAVSPSWPEQDEGPLFP